MLQRISGATLMVLLLTGVAQADNRWIADAVLSRAVLERGAFLACATRDNDKESMELLTRGWKLDLDDSAGILRTAGFPADYIDKLPENFSLQRAVPKFSDNGELTKFCAMLGNWKIRWQQFNLLLPQLELRRLLQQ